MKLNLFRSRMAAVRLGLAFAAGALFLLSRSATGAEKFYLNAAEGGVRYGPFLFENGAPVAFGGNQFVVEKEVTPNDAAMENRLKSIVLPVVSLREAKLDVVIQLLQQRSFELDPLRPPKGVNFVLMPGAASESSALITLSLKQATLLDTLKMVTEVAGLTYRFDGDLVVIEPK
ncbi:MAG TPA: hypothetical protein PK388_07625 [Kiritimatiellia bacterium]|nr:hypothetical protein [Kiritimatiellia bacterium]